MKSNGKLDILQIFLDIFRYSSEVIFRKTDECSQKYKILYS